MRPLCRRFPAWLNACHLVVLLCVFNLHLPAKAQGVSLDLKSTEASQTVHDLPTSGVTIKVGGRQVQIRSGASLTPAQLVAVTQIVNGGKQTLRLNKEGAAAGGFLNLSAEHAIADIVIPRGVKALADFSIQNNVSVLGDISNSGKLFAYSKSNSTQTAIFSAENITNEKGGLISNILPNSLARQISASNNPFELGLSANDTITNHGIIRSSGSLSLTANQIINTPHDDGSQLPNLQASTMALFANQVVNAGSMTATNGDVTWNARRPGDLTLDNTGGVVSAITGKLNVLSPGDVSITDGVITAKEVNVLTECGSVNVHVESSSALMNATAKEAHFSTKDETLKLGDMYLTGDPTFFNTGGNVTISGDIITNGAPLAIVASGGVFASGGALDTSSSTGDGGDLTIIAGASFLPAGKNIGSNDTETVLTIYNDRKPGVHDIDLRGVTRITTASSAPDGSGGRIQIGNFESYDKPSNVYLPENVTVVSGGSGTGSNGDVLIAGPGYYGGAITVGSIDTTGGASGTGSIGITANPLALGQSVTIVNGVLSSPFSSSLSGRYNGVFKVGALTTDGADLHVVTTGALTLNGPIDASSSSATGTGGSVYIRGGTVDRTGTQPLTIKANGGASGNGGLISLSGQNVVLDKVSGLATLSATGGSENGSQGNGGTISIVGASINVECLDVRALGLNGNGGSATIQGTQNGGSISVIGSIDVSGIGTGNGGSIKIESFAISGQAISINGDLTANGGNVSGNGGSITIRTIYSGSMTLLGDVSADAVQGNAGSIYIDTSYSGGTTALYFIDGSLSASATESGNGGSIFVASRSSNEAFVIGNASLHGITGTLRATGGLNGGTGGSVSVGNSGNAYTNGLIVEDLSRISVDAPAGSGGSIGLHSYAGTITLPSGIISVNGGTGDTNGGNISLTGGGIRVLNGPLTLSANGAGSGSGGTVDVHTYESFNVSGSVTVGSTPGSLQITATGGSPGSLAGNGGTVYVNSYHDLDVNGWAIYADPQGINGNGPTIYLSGRESVTASGVLEANGRGSGSGGTIVINYVFWNLGVHLQDTSTVDISGEMHANAGLSGTGGAIRINGVNDVDIAANTILTASSSVIINTHNYPNWVIEGPMSYVSGTTPANVTTEISNNGAVYFNEGIVAAAPDNSITANNGIVAFFTGEHSADSISLGGGVVINSGSEAKDFGSSRLTSLDLMDSDTVARILYLQQNFPNQFGGSLQVTDGQATGGNLILHSGDLATLSAKNIPIGVTLTYQDYSFPVAISLNDTSSTKSVLINGTVEFVSSSGSVASIIIQSNQPYQALEINGSLTSDGSLTVSAAGATYVNGTLSADSDVNLKAAFGSNGLIQIGGNVTANNTINIVADGSGVIDQYGNLTARNIHFGSDTGSIRLYYGIDASDSFRAESGGDIRVTNIHSRNIFLSSSGGTIILDENLDATGVLADGSGGSITIEGKLLANGAQGLYADGTGNGAGGSITVSGPSLSYSDYYPHLELSACGAGTGNGGNVSISMYGGFDGDLNIGTGYQYVVIRATGGSVGSNAGDGGHITVSATWALNIDTSGISANPLGNNGAGGQFEIVQSGMSYTSITGSKLDADGVGTGAGGSIVMRDAGPYGSLIIDAVLSANSDYGNAGEISLLSSGVSIGQAIQANSNYSGNGGVITIESNDIGSYVNPVISANGAGTGNGGSIAITASEVAIGLADGSFVLSATGGSSGSSAGDGGTITIHTASRWQLDTEGLSVTPLGLNGDGGRLTITAESNSYIYSWMWGSLNLSGVGSGKGGTATIAAFSENKLSIGSDSDIIDVSGGANGGDAGSVAIANLGAGGIESGVSIVANSSDGNAGSVLINTLGDVILNGDIIASTVDGAGGTIVIDAGGKLQMTGDVRATGRTAGGIVDITYNGSLGDLTVGASSQNSFIIGQVMADSSNSTGGTINFGSSSGPLTLNLVGTASTAGSNGNGVISFTANDQDVGVTIQGSAIGTVTASGASIDIATSSDLGLVIGDITADIGHLTITSNSAPIEIVQNSTVMANSGDIQIQNLDAQNGTIEIGANSTVQAMAGLIGGVGGEVRIFIGASPVQYEAGTEPANVSTDVSLGGQIYFGDIGFAANSPVNSIKVLGRDVIFSNTGTNVNAIKLDGNVAINASVGTVSLSDLDLTNPETVSLIQYYQSIGVVGGTLVSDESGVSGTVMLTPRVLLNNLSGEYIPSGVVLTLEDFRTNNPINITIDSSSYTPYVRIYGTQEIVSNTVESTGFITVSSAMDTVLHITGNVSAQDNLTIKLTGSAEPILWTDGSISVEGNLVIEGAKLHVGTTGSITAETIAIESSSTNRMVVDNFGFIGTTGGNLIVQGSPYAGMDVYGVVTASVWSAPGNSLIKFMIGQNQTLVLEKNHEFIFTGSTPSGRVIFTSVSESGSAAIRINPIGSLSLGTNNSVLEFHNVNVVNNGTIDLNDPVVSGSSVEITGSQPKIVADGIGDMDLSGFKFLTEGANLVILSRGSILGNPLIDLSSNTASGGNLVVLAGFGFTAPSTSVPLPLVLTLNKPNSAAGSVALGGNISTAGAIDGGSIRVYANLGSIAINSMLTTGSTGESGNITIIGSGVTLNNVVTDASSRFRGEVLVYSAVPIQGFGGGNILISNGTVHDNAFGAGGPYDGNVNIGSISLGESSLLVSTDGVASSINFIGNSPMVYGMNLFAGSGTVNLWSDVIDVYPNSAGNGGYLNINASSVNYPNKSSSPLTINAYGTTGWGGSVGITLSSSAPLVIGNSPGNWRVNATAPSGGGVYFSSGGNIIVDPSALNLQPTDAVYGDGASMVFEAGASGNGTLTVLGSLNAAGGTAATGGSIELTSNSPSAFYINKDGAVNGVWGTISLSGGIKHGWLYVTNNGGGINVGQPLTEVAEVYLDTIQTPGANIRIKGPFAATERMSIASGGRLPSLTFSAPTVILQTTIYDLKAKVDTNRLIASSDSGDVVIRSIGTETISIPGLYLGGSLKFRAIGQIDLSGGINAGGSITVLSELGPIHISGGSNISAGDGDIRFGVGTVSPKSGVFPNVQYRINGQPANPTSPPFYFGENGISAGSAPTSVVMNSVDGGKIIFNTGDLDSSSIRLDSGAGPITFSARSVSHPNFDEHEELIVDTGEDDYALLIGEDAEALGLADHWSNN